MIRTNNLNLPYRECKPRDTGLTILIDNGVPLNYFKDTIASSEAFIDFVKFGWGTSLVTRQIDEKIEWLRAHNIEFFFGGTLFEKFLSQGKVKDYYDYCKQLGCHVVEISNGTLNLTNREKGKYISEFSREFTVFSEVGNKDPKIANTQNSIDWLKNISEDLAAGSTKVITEARESGTCGLFYETGEIRSEIFKDIQSSGIPLSSIIFEAPNKKTQVFFIKEMGYNVNLANIPFSDSIALETLRLGLRSDTFTIFDQEEMNRVEGFKQSLSSSDSV